MTVGHESSLHGPSLRASPPLLEARNLSKHFGGLPAVSGVSVSVDKGEVVSVIGPNGAGKTTFFNLITGFEAPDSGSVLLAGEDVTRLSPHERVDRGMVRSFQLLESFNSLTVRETLIVAGLRRNSLTDARRQASELLERLCLEHRAEDRPSEIPLPDAKMLELGKCLATRPAVILLDEIMSGLTLVEAEIPLRLIRELQERGIGFLLVEHVMPIVMSISDRILIIAQGEPVAEGTPGEVVNDPTVQSVYLGGPRAP